MKIRRFIEILSRGIIYKRKLPDNLGGRSIYVSPEAGLRFWKPNLQNVDPMLSNVVNLFVNEGDIIWDIGTNLGFFSVPAITKSKTGKCLCIEPDIWLCHILHKTKIINPDLNIDILPVAVSNKTGFSRFNIANRSRATNHLAEVTGSSQTGGIRQTRIVPTFTLDFILESYEAPDFLKIDTEGAELLVLAGAEKVISTKPLILIEVNQETLTNVVVLLESKGYKVYNAEKLPDLIPASNQICENLLAIP